VSAAAPPAGREGSQGAEVRSEDSARVLVRALRRGILQVFVPVALAGQALAWIEYAVTHAYRPWSWAKIGLAYALSGSRVTFEASRSIATFEAPGAVTAEQLVLAVGAFVALTLVLSFRAGREQARGMTAPLGRMAAVGSTVGLGFASACGLSSLLLTLSFPDLGITSLRPVTWLAFALPLAFGTLAGGVGGAAAGLTTTPDARTRRAAAAAVGAWLAFVWGLGLALVGFLVLATVETGATSMYARTMRDAGSAGAILVVHHALLLPNQSTMILATSMGAPTELAVDGETAARLSVGGVEAVGDYGAFAEGYVGRSALRFPSWYRGFLLVPAVATVLAGRSVRAGTTKRIEALVRASLAGVGFAALAATAAWIATIVIPIAAFGGSMQIGADPLTTLLVALPWGLVGCLIGSATPAGRAPTSRWSRDAPR
jgi:hypothetical protein